MNGSTRSHLSCIAVMLAGIILGVFLSPADLVAAQQTGLKDMTYVSPTWGFTVRWYSTEWTVAGESSEGRTDILELQDPLGNVIAFSGTPQSGGDAETCLDGMIEEALAVPGALDVVMALNDFGEPFEWREPNQAYTLFQVRIPVGDVLQDHAVYLECQTLVPGEAVFKRSYSGPVAVFDQWYDDIVETLEGVFLPASAWWPMPESTRVWAGSAPLIGDWRANGALLPSPEDPQLLVGQVDAAGDVHVVTFENVGASPATAEPGNLVLTVSSISADVSGPIQQPHAIAWDDGQNANADDSRVLTPGERATAQVSIAPIDESAVVCDGLPWLVLEYRQSEGEPAVLASTPVQRCLDEMLQTSATPGRPILQLSR